MWRESSSLPNRTVRRRPFGCSQESKRGPSGPLFLLRAGFQCARRKLGLRWNQLAFLIRLLLRHWVHTRIRFGAPSTKMRTVWRLGYQRRLLRLFAWLTLLPVTGPLAHTAHTRAISSTSVFVS